jgi:hypothetical protein
MSDPLTLLNRRLKQYVDLVPAARFSGSAKAISPSYFANLGVFQPRFILEPYAASPGRRLRFEGRFSPTTAFMAIV